MTASFPFRIDADAKLRFDQPDRWQCFLRAARSSRGELLVHIPESADTDPDLPRADRPRRTLPVDPQGGR